ncbi:MAG TPA: DinB family protein [Vicinamibacterales bacterium]
MSIKDSLLPEFDHEMGSTRRLLERIPEAQFGWRPHEKSYSLGALSSHLANIPHWVDAALDAPEFDLATAPDARTDSPPSLSDLLQRFDASVKSARAKLADQTDASLLAPWTLKNGGHEMFTMPRLSVLRSFVLNHVIHHRGQLTVYLRLQNVPLPSLYGPTADEP